MSDTNLEWKFVQSFGDDNSSDDDLVTALQFDHNGDYLAVGDKAGRICIFEANEQAASQAVKHNGTANPSLKSSTVPLEYKFYTEFQSHEPEFDCLKSLEIEEKINAIKFGPRNSNGVFLLATNDKTIKYWKVHEKKMKQIQNPVRMRNSVTGQYISQSQQNQSISQSSQLVIPRLTSTQTLTTATPKRVFANAHGYHINSLSINSDCETFISVDDLRINLWSINQSVDSFNLIDLKPSNLEELTEVITAATFHPQHCSLLTYATSRGSIKLLDLRDGSHVHPTDQSVRSFDCMEDPASKSFFSEIVSSISDVQFCEPNGRYLLSRDYMTLKIWDCAMEQKPVQTINVHDFLKPHLCDLYENDCIFDKFQCSSSKDGKKLVSGSYNNHFIVHNLADTSVNQQVTIEALKDGPRLKPTVRGKAALMKKGALIQKQDHIQDNHNVNMMDFGKKALHISYHPSQDVIAVAGLNKLYIYQAFQALHGA